MVWRNGCGMKHNLQSTTDASQADLIVACGVSSFVVTYPHPPEISKISCRGKNLGVRGFSQKNPGLSASFLRFGGTSPACFNGACSDYFRAMPRKKGVPALPFARTPGALKTPPLCLAPTAGRGREVGLLRARMFLLRTPKHPPASHIRRFFLMCASSCCRVGQWDLRCSGVVVVVVVGQGGRSSRTTATLEWEMRRFRAVWAQQTAGTRRGGGGGGGTRRRWSWSCSSVPRESTRTFTA